MTASFWIVGLGSLPNDGQECIKNKNRADAKIEEEDRAAFLPRGLVVCADGATIQVAVGLCNIG